MTSVILNNQQALKSFVKTETMKNLDAPSLVTPYDGVRCLMVLKNNLVSQDDTATQRVHREHQFFGIDYIMDTSKPFGHYLYSSYEENLLGNIEAEQDDGADDGGDEKENDKKPEAGSPVVAKSALKKGGLKKGGLKKGGLKKTDDNGSAPSAAARKGNDQHNDPNTDSSYGYTEVAYLDSESLKEIFELNGNLFDTLVYQEKVRMLRRVFLFKHLSYGHMKKLVNALHCEEYVKGDVVMQQGTIGTHFYVIKSGHASIKKNNVVLKTLGEFDYFGERALLSTQRDPGGVHPSPNGDRPNTIVGTIALLDS